MADLWFVCCFGEKWYTFGCAFNLRGLIFSMGSSQQSSIYHNLCFSIYCCVCLDFNNKWVWTHWRLNQARLFNTPKPPKMWNYVKIPGTWLFIHFCKQFCYYFVMLLVLLIQKYAKIQQLHKSLNIIQPLLFKLISHRWELGCKQK